MEIRNLIVNEDAVSPVIGVILMVAITVILAAVIGAFVLGFGGGGPSAPSVQWEASDDGANVIFEHGGGDDIDSPSEVLDITGGDGADETESPSTTGSGPLSTGDTVSEDVTAATGVSAPGGEYLLVWENDGSSQELSTYSP